MTLGLMPLPGLVPGHQHFTRHCFTPSVQRQTSWYFYENSLNLHLPNPLKGLPRARAHRPYSEHGFMASRAAVLAAPSSRLGPVHGPLYSDGLDHFFDLVCFSSPWKHLEGNVVSHQWLSQCHK